MNAEAHPDAEPRRPLWHRPWARLALVAAAVVVSLVVAHQSGALAHLTPQAIQAFVSDAGPLAVLAFVAVFVVGQLLHVPGPVLIGAGVLAFGANLGGPLSWLAATVAVSVNFVLMRALGGRALSELDRPRVQRWLRRLEQRPLATVLLVRMAFFTSPAVSTAFAMSPVRFREHLAGSFVGMALPILAVAFFADDVLAAFFR